MKLRDRFAELRSDYKENACAWKNDVIALLDFTDVAIAVFDYALDKRNFEHDSMSHVSLGRIRDKIRECRTKLDEEVG